MPLTVLMPLIAAPLTVGSPDSCVYGAASTGIAGISMGPSALANAYSVAASGTDERPTGGGPPILPQSALPRPCCTQAVNLNDILAQGDEHATCT